MSIESHKRHEDHEKAKHHQTHPAPQSRFGLPFHPLWFAVLGVLLTLAAIFAWSLL
jgi:hypothetical protein